MPKAKRSTRLLVAAGILVLLVGTYFIVKAIPKPQKGPKTTSIKVASVSQADVTKVEIKNGTDTLVVERKGDKFEPVLPYPMKIDSSAVQRILYNVTSVFAQRVVEQKVSDPKALAKYGLESPQDTTTVFQKSGSPIVYKIGSQTPGKDGYYFQKAGDPQVYTLDTYSAHSMMLSLTDLRDHSLPSIDAKKLTYLMIDNGKQRIVIRTTPPGFKTEEATFSNLVMTSPYPGIHAVATDKLGNILKGLPNFTIDKFVSDHPTNLSEYGLDPAEQHLVIKDDKNTLDLLIGKTAPGGTHYAKLADAPTVFTIDANLDFMNTTAFDLVDKFALIVNIDKVDSMKIVTPKKTFTAVLTRTGTGDKKKTSYTFDGKDVNEKYFKNFYQKAIAILYDAENPAPKPGKTEVSFSFTLNTAGHPTLSVDFVPFNQNFYQIYRNGKSEFVVTRSQVENVIQAADLLAQGKDPGTS